MSYLNLTPDDSKFQQEKDNRISDMSVFTIENSEFLVVTITKER